MREYCIKHQKPYLVEAMTFRMRGHEEASGTKYVPQNLFDLWEKKDPVKNYEQYLSDQHILSPADIGDIKNELKEKIEQELAIGMNANPVVVDTEEELNDVYAEREVRNQTPMAIGAEVRVVDNSGLLSHFGLP